MRLDDALERFLLQQKANGRSPHTVAQYSRHLDAFGRWLPSHCALDSITPEHLAKYISGESVQQSADGTGKKPTTINALRSSLRVFFQFATRARYVNNDPSRLLRRARCATAPPRVLAPDDIGRLLGTMANATDPMAPRDHAMIHALVATGIRAGSLVALDIGDVEVSQGELVLRTAKGNQPQRVVMPPQLRQHLATYINGKEHGPLFANSKGDALSVRHVERRLAYWLERAGIFAHASPHTLRHSFAMRVYEHTGDVLLVKEALGHRSISSSLVYAHADRRRLRDALNSIPVAVVNTQEIARNEVIPSAHEG